MEEFDIIQILRLLWLKKRWIAASVLLGTLAGGVYGFFATPVYKSFATISPKEGGKSGDASRFLSQIGGVGGVVASQLGMGNTNLDKLEIMIKGYDLAESVVVRHNLLPVLFPKKWDSKRRAWKSNDAKSIPTVTQGVGVLQGKVLDVTPDFKKNVMRVEAGLSDPIMAKRVVEYYIEEVNRKIREGTVSESDANRVYLERQLGNTLDPVLMEKIRMMIAYEIERAMLVNINSVDVLEKPRVPLRKSEPRMLRVIVLMGFAGFFVSTVYVVGKVMFSVLKAKILWG